MTVDPLGNTEVGGWRSPLSTFDVFEPTIIEFTLPSALEEEKQWEFTTYKNYVAAVAYLLSEDAFVERVVQTSRFSRIDRRTNLDLQHLGRILRLAWVTEINLRTSVEMAGPTLAGHNALHQCYYGPYSAMRAYFFASGLEVPRSHQAHLRAITDTVAQRSTLFPDAMALLALGDPDGTSFELRSLPHDRDISEVSNLAWFEPEMAWSLEAKFLKTTRRRQLEAVLAEWRTAKDKKRVPSRERASLALRLPPTSLFHCLYRMRVRSDYQDADAFLLGVVSDAEAASFCDDLASITYYLDMTFELLIAKYAGKAAFIQFVEMFSESDKFGHSEETIQRRLQHILRHF